MKVIKSSSKLQSTKTSLDSKNFNLLKVQNNISSVCRENDNCGGAWSH